MRPGRELCIENQLHVIHSFVQQIFPEILTGGRQGARHRGCEDEPPRYNPVPVTIRAGGSQALRGTYGDDNGIPDLVELPVVSGLCFCLPSKLPTLFPLLFIKYFPASLAM